jgi:hypothetical protein
MAGTVWNKQSISDLLMRNDLACERAILKLYRRQTNVEKSVGHTMEHNSVGFSGVDSKIFSSFAEQILRGRSLTQNQLGVCRKIGKGGCAKLSKYWRQLLETDS